MCAFLKWEPDEDILLQKHNAFILLKQPQEKLVKQTGKNPACMSRENK